MTKSILLFLFVHSLTSFNRLTAQKMTAGYLIQKCEAAMGQGGNNNPVISIKKTGKAHAYLIDQSVRPEGPLAVNYIEFSVASLLLKNKAIYTKKLPLPGGGMFALKFLIDKDISGMVAGKNFQAFGEAIDEEFYLSPEYVLKLAKEGNARYQKDTLWAGVLYHIINFEWKRFPVRIYINSNSFLLSAVEIKRQYHDDVPYVLGDTKKIYRYSGWQLLNGNFHYPFQRDVYINNTHWQSSTLDSVKLNEPVAEDSLSIADTEKEKLLNGYSKANPFTDIQLQSKEVFKDIYFIRGGRTILGTYNCWLINTAEGVIVIEAPVTSGYSRSVMNEANKLFPGKNIIGVINTSDAWVHIGGLREYAARNIPIYTLNLNVPLISRLMSADYSTVNDSLQKRAVKANLKAIKGKTIIGKGEDRIEIYPVYTETGERMLMVYIPKYKLLHTADLIQATSNLPPMLQQYLSEIKFAIDRDKLDVDTVIGMHIGATKLEDILQNSQKK